MSVVMRKNQFSCRKSLFTEHGQSWGTLQAIICSPLHPRQCILAKHW